VSAQASQGLACEIGRITLKCTKRSMPDRFAIVGISALLPGAPNTSAFYNNVISRTSFVDNAKSEWLGNSFSNEEEYIPGRIRSRLRGSIEDIAFFNPLDYGIMPKAIDGGDPDHYLSLKVASEALKDAGLPNGYDHTNTGVVVGRGTYFNRGFGTVFQHGIVIDQTIEILREFVDEAVLNDVRKKIEFSLPSFNADMVGGIIPNLVSGRIANKLGLGGPNFLIDAACASSLIAVEHACEQLSLGKSDLMLVGGVQASTPPQVHMVFDVLDALARTDLKPLCQKSQGTVLSEGVGFVAICLSEYAVKQGIDIYAEIESFGSSSDGKGMGLFAPSSEGQKLALKRAYRRIDGLKEKVRYVETHATGMPLGDATEIQTILSEFFQEKNRAIHIGNIKSLIGHCIPASGIAGLINTTLAVKNGIFPPLGIEDPIKELSDRGDFLRFRRRPQPWLGSEKSPRVGAVNAFGFGGINSHIVISQCTSERRRISETTDLLWNIGIFFVIGSDRDEFARNCENIISTITKEKFHQVSLESLKTAQQGAGRSGRHIRGYVIGKDPGEVCKRLEALKIKVNKAEDSDNKIVHLRGKKHTAARFSNGLNEGKGPVFVYPGEGSQSAGMLNELAIHFPMVNEWVSKITESLGVDVSLCEEIIEREGGETALPAEGYEINLSTGLVFMANMCVSQLLMSWGIRPKAHIGHSTGQNSAIFASGWLCTEGEASVCEEACKQVDMMKKAWQKVKGQDNIEGDYKVYVLQQPDVVKLQMLMDEMNDKFIVSMKNCPDQYIVVVSGSESTGFRSKLEECCVMLFDMPISRPYHTHFMQSVSIQMKSLYTDVIKYNEECREAVYSCLTGRSIENKAEVEKELAELMDTPVDFEKAIKNMHNDGYRLFVECGNGSSTTNFMRSIFNSNGIVDADVVTSQAISKGGLEALIECIGSTWTMGYEIDMKYIQCQAELEKKVKDGYEKKQGELQLSLLMPKASIDSHVKWMESNEVKQVMKPSVHKSIDGAEGDESTGIVGRCVLTDTSPALADHLLPNRRKGYTGNWIKGQSVVPMAIFVGLAVSAVKKRSKLAVLRDVRMQKWAEANEKNEFIVSLENDGHNNIYSVSHNQEASLTSIRVDTNLSEIEKKSAERLGLREKDDMSIKPYMWANDELYRHGMFHEAFYQVVKQIRYCDNKFIEGVMETTNHSSILNLFQVLDGLAQLSAFWAAPDKGLNFHTFPASIKRLEVDDIEGIPTSYTFRVANTANTDTLLSFSGILQDTVGKVVLEFEDFSHSFVRLPKSYHQCFADCEGAFYTQSIPTGSRDVALVIIPQSDNLSKYADVKKFFLSVFKRMWFNNQELRILGRHLDNSEVLGQLLSRKEVVRRLLGQQGTSKRARDVSALTDGSICIVDQVRKGVKARFVPYTLYHNGNVVTICAASRRAALVALDSPKLDSQNESRHIQLCMQKALSKVVGHSLDLRDLKHLQRVNESIIRGTLSGLNVVAGCFRLGATSYGWAAVEFKK